MKIDDKIKIVDALVEIKLALSNYSNSITDNTHNAEVKQLKSAFENVDNISKIIRKN